MVFLRKGLRQTIEIPRVSWRVGGESRGNEGKMAGLTSVGFPEHPFSRSAPAPVLFRNMDDPIPLI